jgi:hypothetical protein
MRDALLASCFVVRLNFEFVYPFFCVFFCPAVFRLRICFFFWRGTRYTQVRHLGQKTLDSAVGFCVVSGIHCAVTWKADSEMRCESLFFYSVVLASFELLIPEAEISSFARYVMGPRGFILSL